MVETNYVGHYKLENSFSIGIIDIGIMMVVSCQKFGELGFLDLVEYHTVCSATYIVTFLWPIVEEI